MAKPPPLPQPAAKSPPKVTQPRIPTKRPAPRPPRSYPRPGTASRTRITPTPPPVQGDSGASHPNQSGFRSTGQVLVSRPPIVVKSTSPESAHSGGSTKAARGPGDSLFESSLITEKSLDEVILAYLSEDED
jgi:hypothetical protein